MDNPVCIPTFPGIGTVVAVACQGCRITGTDHTSHTTVHHFAIERASFSGRSEKVAVDQRVYSSGTFYLLENEGTHGDNRHQRTGVRVRIETVTFFPQKLINPVETVS